MLATVNVRNVRTGVVGGLFSVVDYEFAVFAEPGDRMVIWYQTESEISTAVPFLIDRTSPIVGDGGR
jgi:hypothetical protein